MAPSTSASLTIPLVFALAGNATWFVYLLATGSMLLVGFCVSRFARLSASPGSLYSYTADTLPPAFGVVAAWGLLLAYLATGASVAGGALYYATVLCQQFFHWAPPAIPTLAVVCLVAGCIAYRDVKLSAEVMLWIEAVSVSLILIVLVLLPVRMGLHFDTRQFQLQGSSRILAGRRRWCFPFSALWDSRAPPRWAARRASLCKTIPRAVLQCALLSGVFFMLCAYSEVLGFRGESSALSDTTSPLHLLARKAGVSPLGVAIDVGAFISMFACVLACATAAARVLMRMARSGLLPAAFERTNRRHGTPGAGIILSHSPDLRCGCPSMALERRHRILHVRPAAAPSRSSAFSPPTRWWRWRFPLRAERSASIRTWLRQSASSPSRSSFSSRFSISTPPPTPFTREFPIFISVTSPRDWVGTDCGGHECKSLKICGKRATNRLDMTTNPYMNFMPQTLTSRVTRVVAGPTF